MTSALQSPNPEGLQIGEIEVRGEVLLVRATTTSKGALCPLCQNYSDKIHSRYERTLADLPCSGLVLNVNHFNHRIASRKTGSPHGMRNEV